MDTTNDFLIGVRGELVGPILPIAGAMTKDKALRTAAWLVALAEDNEGDFQKVLAAVQNT